MSGAEKSTYIYLVLFVLAILLLTGCAGQKTQDGELASYAALNNALESAELCATTTATMWNNQETAYMQKLDLIKNEAVLTALMMNWAYVNKDAIGNTLAKCYNPVIEVARQFNLSDQQRWQVQASVARFGIGFTGGYLITDAIFSSIASMQGDEYNLLGTGARQIKITDDDTIHERGWTVFGGDRTNDTPNGGASDIARGGNSTPVSNSVGRDSILIGNTSNLSVNTGKNGSSPAITDIPNFSPDPALGEVSGESSITSQPVSSE